MRAGQGIIIIAITLLMIGVVMVNSAAMRVSPETPLTFLDMLLSRPSILAFGACIAMFIGMRFPLRLIEKKILGIPCIVWVSAVAFCLLIAVYIPGIGKEVNAANRWIEIGGFSFQPSEVMKWVVVLVAAWWTANKFDTLKHYWKGFVPPIACIGFVCAIIAVEDLGTAVLVFAVACFILYAAGAKLLHFVSLVPVATAGFAMAVLSNPYRISRLQVYLNPYDDPETSGYHILQSMHAISAGGLSGLGLGNGIHKFGYLPEDTTDFIFAVICEELGVFGASAVGLLYIGIMILGIYVIKNAKTFFQKLLTIGVLLTIGLQASMNVLVVTALIPTKGIALPLLSNGGTGWLLTAFCIGLIDAIDRSNQRETHSANLNAYTEQHA